jgi:hypothetical protein
LEGIDVKEISYVVNYTIYQRVYKSICSTVVEEQQGQGQKGLSLTVYNRKK